MNPRHVLAIARLTLRDAMRSRLLPSVAILLLAVVAGLPFLVSNPDGGAGAGRLFVILQYSMGAILFLLTVATLWASCGAVAGDIADRRLQLVLAKPVHRRDIWIGKWLGIMTQNIILLAFAGVLAGGILRHTWSGLPPDSAERRETGARLLTARIALRPDMPEEILRRIAGREKTIEREDHGHLHAGGKLRAEAEQQVIRSSMIVPPGGSLFLHYSGVPRFHAGQPAELRCTFQASRPESGFITGFWRIAADSGQSVEVPFTNRPGLPVRILIPPIGGDPGALTVSIHRTDAQNPSHLLLAPKGDPPELLVPAGGFEPNLARSLLALLFRLSFVAAIGVTMGCLLSVPVSVFAGFALLIVLHMTGFVATVASTGALVVSHHGEVAPSVWLDRVILHVLTAINGVTAPLEILNPLPALADGRMVPVAFTARAFGILAVLYTVGAAIPGVLLFNRRELP